MVVHRVMLAFPFFAFLPCSSSFASERLLNFRQQHFDGQHYYTSPCVEMRGAGLGFFSSNDLPELAIELELRAKTRNETRDIETKRP